MSFLLCLKLYSHGALVCIHDEVVEIVLSSLLGARTFEVRNFASYECVAPSINFYEVSLKHFSLKELELLTEAPVIIFKVLDVYFLIRNLARTR